MAHVLRAGWLCSLAVLVATACTVAPRPGSPVPPAVELLPADGRALAYGQSVDQVLQNPEVGDKIRALFGPDWMPASQGGGQLVLGAAPYFERGGPLRMVRIGGVDYIAVTGCVPRDCATQRVLLFIREGGSQLLARLDEGGFSHYYGYGSEALTRDTAPMVVDSGLRALKRTGNPYPSTTS
jgi:hypothetical protein